VDPASQPDRHGQHTALVRAGLIERGTGHIINIASIAGLTPIIGGGNAPYAASKFAVVGLSETLRVEHATAAPATRHHRRLPGPAATHPRRRTQSPASLAGGTAAVTAPTFTNAAASTSPDNAAAQILAAAQMLAAVEADQFYLLANPANAAEVREPVRQLLADLPETP
jgi:short-subunit dehydrogenase